MVLVAAVQRPRAALTGPGIPTKEIEEVPTPDSANGVPVTFDQVPTTELMKTETAFAWWVETVSASVAPAKAATEERK